MQFSDALAMGRTILAPIRGYVFVPGARGCALGMAGSAQGLTLVAAVGSQHENYTVIEKQWPWLKKKPPLCPVCDYSGYSFTDTITHIFDGHVANISPNQSLKPRPTH